MGVEPIEGTFNALQLVSSSLTTMLNNTLLFQVVRQGTFDGHCMCVKLAVMA
jgi:hypothetical protein